MEIRTNLRSDAGIINPDTGYHLELDVYISEIRLAFEYQDIHHYQSAWYADQPLALYQERDKKKKELAHAAGIDLILIPYWWDGRQDR